MSKDRYTAVPIKKVVFLFNIKDLAYSLILTERGLNVNIFAPSYMMMDKCA